MSANQLLYGDNLDILRRHVADETVDLVYLDPPFKSNQDYNVLFAERDGTRAAAQIKAFKDTWRWDDAAARAYEEVVESGDRVADALRAFRMCIGRNDMLAYLSMMAPRLSELRRVLKPTGSLYLHCDPTSSHYLKVLLDAVFRPENFRGEVVWKRSSAHSDTKQGSKQPGRIHDVLLFYTKTSDWMWNEVYTPYSDSYVNTFYRHVEEGTDRQFRRGDLTAARPGGDTRCEWRVKKRAAVRERWVADLDDEYLNPAADWEYKGVRPYRGRYWAYSKRNMRAFARDGRLSHTFTGMPEYKRYLDEMPGVPLQDLWTDIPPIGPARHCRTARLPHAETGSAPEAHPPGQQQRRGPDPGPVLWVRNHGRGGGTVGAPLARDRYHAPRDQPHPASAAPLTWGPDRRDVRCRRRAGRDARCRNARAG